MEADTFGPPPPDDVMFVASASRVRDSRPPSLERPTPSRMSSITERRGNEPSFGGSRRSGGRRGMADNAEGSDEDADVRDGDFNGTKASD